MRHSREKEMMQVNGFICVRYCGNFSGWWENKRRKDQFVVAENEKHKKEIDKLKQVAARSSQWADKNGRCRISL